MLAGPLLPLCAMLGTEAWINVGRTSALNKRQCISRPVGTDSTSARRTCAEGADQELQQVPQLHKASYPSRFPRCVPWLVWDLDWLHTWPCTGLLSEVAAVP
jgi:hypothetical protein